MGLNEVEPELGLVTNDLNSARFFVVVCGPAAAAEGAEEGAHFGSEGDRLVGHLPFDGVGVEVSRWKSWMESVSVVDEAGELFFFLFASPARRADV
jgi:hypothetical protein